MSEENQSVVVVPVEQPQAPSIPQDVLDLQQAVADYSEYRTAVSLGLFVGSKSEVIVKLREHLNVMYQQLLKQFNEHPYVVEVRAKNPK